MSAPILLTDIGATYAKIVSDYPAEFAVGYTDGYYAYINDSKDEQWWDVEAYNDDPFAALAYAIGTAIGQSNASSWIYFGEVDEYNLPNETLITGGIEDEY